MDSGFSILSVAPRVAPRTVVQFLTLELDLNSGGEKHASRARSPLDTAKWPAVTVTES